MSSFNELPDELIGSVLQHLNVEERKKASLISDSWRRCLTRRTGLADCTVKLCSRQSVERMHQLLAQTRHLRLNVPKEPKQVPVDRQASSVQFFGPVFNILQHCPALVTLELHLSEYEQCCNCPSLADRAGQLFACAVGNLAHLRRLRCTHGASVNISDTLCELLKASVRLEELDLTVTKYDTDAVKKLLAAVPTSVRSLAIRPKSYPNRESHSYLPIIRAFGDLADRGVRLDYLYLPVGPRELFDGSLAASMQRLLATFAQVRLDIGFYGCGRENEAWYVAMSGFLAIVKSRCAAVDLRMSDLATQHAVRRFQPANLLGEMASERLDSFSICVLTVRQFDGASAQDFSLNQNRFSLKRLSLDCPLSDASSLVSALCNLRVLRIQSSMQGNWKRVESYAWKDEQLLGRIAVCCPYLEVLITDEIARISILSNSDTRKLHFAHLRKLAFPVDCRMADRMNFRIDAPCLQSLKVVFVNETPSKDAVKDFVSKVFASVINFAVAREPTKPLPPHLVLWRKILENCPNLVNVGVVTSKTIFSLPEWWQTAAMLKFLRTMRIRCVSVDVLSNSEQTSEAIRCCKSLRRIKFRGLSGTAAFLRQSIADNDSVTLITSN